MVIDTSSVCVADGGLINPTNFPCKSADFSKAVISAAGTQVKAIGTSVVSSAALANTAWAKVQVPGVFETPDKEAVYALMSPATAAADTMNEATKRIGDAIVTYADDLSTVKTKLEEFEKRAAEFRTEALAGYEVSNWDARGWFGNFDTDLYGNPVPKDDAYETTTISWQEHAPAVEKNQTLLAEYNGLLAETSAAATTCANTIQRELSNRCVAPYEPLSEDAMNASPDFSSGWGQPVDEQRNCTESVGHGADKFWYNTWSGAATLVGYDDSNKNWSWGRAGESWLGVGDFALSTALLFSPPASIAASVNPDFADFMDDRMDVAVGGWGGIIGWDQQAFKAGENGWHKWEKDGVAALTESVLNIGTFFLPAAGVAGGVGKSVLTSTKIGSTAIRIVTKLSEVVIPGGSHLIAGVTRIVDLSLVAGKTGWHGLIDSIKAVDVTPTAVPGVINSALDTPVAHETPVTHAGEAGQPSNASHPVVDRGPEGTPTDLTGKPEVDTGRSDPASADAPKAAPDGGPTHDKYGNEYTFGEDGKRHLEGDPENTYRDTNGALHDQQTGNFTSDPNKPNANGLPTEQGIKADTRYDVEIDAQHRAEHDALVDERSGAQAASDKAGARLEEVANDANVAPDVLRHSRENVETALAKLEETGAITERQLTALLDAANEARDAMTKLQLASEALGDHAAQSISDLRGETTLVDAGGASAQRVDHASLGDGPPPHLTVYEAKGGSSSLSAKPIDGVQAQQGSSRYLDVVLQSDHRIADGLRDYIGRTDADPAIVEAIKNGTLEIRYELVQARADGSINVTPFVIDPSKIRIPRI